jgi:hypothetical protein
VWLKGGSHAQNFQPSEAPARPIRTLDERASTGLPALLLGLKNRQRLLGRAGASSFLLPAPKSLSRSLSEAPVKMLLYLETEEEANKGHKRTHGHPLFMHNFFVHSFLRPLKKYYKLK